MHIAHPTKLARAELDTSHGKAASGWEQHGNEIRMEVIVPSNTQATIEFPDDRASATVPAGTHRFVEPDSRR